MHALAIGLETSGAHKRIDRGQEDWNLPCESEQSDVILQPGLGNAASPVGKVGPCASDDQRRVPTRVRAASAPRVEKHIEALAAVDAKCTNEGNQGPVQR